MRFKDMRMAEKAERTQDEPKIKIDPNAEQTINPDEPNKTKKPKKKRRKLEPGEKPFNCRSCQMTFRTPSKRRGHEKSHHEHDKAIQSEQDITSVSVQDSEDKKPSKDRKPSDAKKKKKRTSFPCRKGCEKIFKAGGMRKNHERVHLGVKEFGCTHCEKMFMQPHHLKHHIKTHNEEEQGTTELAE